MNLVLPSKFEGKSKGEMAVWRVFKEYLGEGYISFHNRYIGGKQVDVVLICPNRGILTIEIKGIRAESIKGIEGLSRIVMEGYTDIVDPLNQADGYRYNLINRLKESHIRSVYVMSAVCFPFLTREECEEKGIVDLVDPIRIFTSQDLQSREALQAKIDAIFTWTYKEIRSKQLKKYRFNGKTFEKAVKSIYSNIVIPKEILEAIKISQSIREKNPIQVLNIPNGNLTEYVKVSKTVMSAHTLIEQLPYSRLIYVQKETDFDEAYYTKVIEDWLKGVKILLYVSEITLYNKFRDILDKKCRQRKIKMPFLFTLGQIDLGTKSFEIKNGESQQYKQYEVEVDKLDRESSFNKGQYEVEHSPLQDIIVKAGAGTGKTYSMISRINFLIWKCSYSPKEFMKAIMMITFTNESTNTMKQKIQDNFMSLYRLTKNVKYLEYVECIEDMKICTIHSMAKNIIQKYGYLLGLGKDFGITLGEYQRKQFLNQSLNQYAERNNTLAIQSSMSMFQLQDRLNKMLSKLDNKNIDLIGEKDIDFGKCKVAYFNQLIDVMKEAQVAMRTYCDENNTVALGDIIRRLKDVCYALEKTGLRRNEKVDFLFVDEFQDTDDVQINLMLQFQQFFDFKFFVVGDLKQCIYRFRGAETRAFDVLEGSKRIENKFLKLSLNKNYRTDPLLMEALNYNFIKWHQNEEIDYTGRDILRAAKPSLYVGEDKDELKKGIEKITLDEADFEIKLIEQLQAIQTELQVLNRNNPKERARAAILVRENWQIKIITELCKKNKVAIETDVGGELFKIDPTLDLFKLVKALLNSESSGHLYALYTTAYVEDELLKVELLKYTEAELIEAFKKNPPIKKWGSYIKRLQDEPILKVLQDIIKDVAPEINFARKMTNDLDEERRYRRYYIRNLNQVFEKLIVKSNTDYLTLSKVAKYLEVMVLTRQEEEARETYSGLDEYVDFICTTVHKSKGLEYDTVIMPYINFDISCKKPKGDVDVIYLNHQVGYYIKGENTRDIIQNDIYETYIKGEAEDRKKEETRILYVALTRAIRRVVCLYVNTNQSPKIQYTWNNMIEVI